MTLQERVLKALDGRALVPKVLYTLLVNDDPEAVDSALRGLMKAGRIVLRSGHFQQADVPCESAPRKKKRRRPECVRAELGAPLTHREEEIAQLASEGHTAQVLAERLKIALKSVHRHLTNIYRKLGIGGKSELADALRVRAAGAMTKDAE